MFLIICSVFWDLYCAAPERRESCDHSSEAKAFHDYVSFNHLSTIFDELFFGLSLSRKILYSHTFIAQKCIIRSKNRPGLCQLWLQRKWNASCKYCRDFDVGSSTPFLFRKLARVRFDLIP